MAYETICIEMPCEQAAELYRFCSEHRLTLDELEKYLGSGAGYGWHISNLKIYDMPRELREFGVNHPFQSWGYVYE